MIDLIDMARDHILKHSLKVINRCGYVAHTATQTVSAIKHKTKRDKRGLGHVLMFCECG